MNQHRLTVWTIALLLGTARLAGAQVTLDTGFSHGTSTITTVCTSTATASPLSDTCQGSLTVAPGEVGRFSGAATAQASSNSGIALGTQLSLDVWRTNPGYFSNNDRYYAVVYTSAVINDSIAIRGAGTLTSGILRLVFDVHGAVVEVLDDYTLDGFNPTIVGDQFFATGGVQVRANGVSSPYLVADATVTLDVPMPFGRFTPLSLGLLATASADVLVSEGYRVLADFLNTATLTDSFVLDTAGNPVSGAYVESANGYQYPGLTGQPISAQIDALVTMVKGMNLHMGIANSLDAKLAAVLRASDAVEAGDAPQACGLIGAFRNEVAAQSGNKLTVAQASELTDAAEQLLAFLGCGGPRSPQ